MEIIQHTLGWIKGELFESKMIIAFGSITIVLGLLFSRIGTTPHAKALFLPLLFVGIVYFAIGSNMLLSNTKRLQEAPVLFAQNKQAFAQQEKQRVDNFQYQYKISKAIATVFFIVTLLIFWSTKNQNWQGIGIGLSLFGLAGLLIDYFSEERAGIYYQELLKLAQQ